MIFRLFRCMVVTAFTVAICLSLWGRSLQSTAVVVDDSRVDEKTSAVVISPNVVGVDDILRRHKFVRDDAAMIVDACKDNACWSPDRLALLLAIRKAEGGDSGIQWGIECRRGSSYRVQAGWAAATVSKFLGRSPVTVAAIDRLSRKYCPVNAVVWNRNVLFWYKRLSSETKALWRETIQG